MKLCIYCAGGLGKEVLDLAEEINEAERRWTEIVFIDDVTEEKSVCGCRIFRFEEIAGGDVSDVEFAIANGEPEARRILHEKCMAAGLRPAGLIHPSVKISRTARVGAGVIIREGSFVCPDAVLGDNVYLQPYVGIGHDVEIGSHTVLSTYVTAPGKCRIGDCVYVAIGAVMKDGISIGDYAVLGLGAVVVRNVKEKAIMMGNPAKRIGTNEEKTVFHRFS